MYCVNCGKEISEGTAFCPNCGAAQQKTMSSAPDTGSYANPLNQPMAKKAPYNGMCIIGLVISGISLLLNFWGIVGIAGTIVSVIGLINCQKKKESGKILAIIGIVIGVYSIFYGVYALLTLM